MSKFSNIPLTREFRPVVLSALRSLPTWGAYRERNGIPANGPHKNEDIYAACETLGFDLLGAYQRHILGPKGAAAEAEGAEAPEGAEAEGAEAPAPAGYEGRDVASVIAEILSPVGR